MKKILIVLVFLIFSTSALTDPKMELGLEVFNNKAQCGMCHILKTARSEGQIGPNLDQLKPLMSQVVTTVTKGIGVMPAFEGILSAEEIEAVAHFVSTSAGQ